MELLSRDNYLARLRKATGRSVITALLGPRQCGKTTLARMFADTLSQPVDFFDLESLPDQRRLQNPELVLGKAEGLVVLDEIQVMPSLFSTLRVLADRSGRPGRFLILGSASPRLIKSASESLAGRIEFIELAGFDITETAEIPAEKLWLRGGFPRALLAPSDEDSNAWREGFVRTFLERDLAQFGINVPAVAMRRFWMMLAHYHGQVLNRSELARSMGVSDKTIGSYLDILTGAYVVRQLQPWYANLKKRQVKSPKIYFMDSGLLHTLLGISSHRDLLGHPKVGASWEGFVIEQILRAAKPAAAFFWATHTGAEIDLFLQIGGRRIGVEVKFSEAPRLTPSMRIGLRDLGLEHLWVVYPGRKSFPLDDRITACSLDRVISSIS
ncbi:MAG: ATP-binding protein [Deltaproteobacteria bacterium]|nr:MAG: ATP-binding protein [Deltaproteobacteria bacterium]